MEAARCFAGGWDGRKATYRPGCGGQGNEGAREWEGASAGFHSFAHHSFAHYLARQGVAFRVLRRFSQRFNSCYHFIDRRFGAVVADSRHRELDLILAGRTAYDANPITLVINQLDLTVRTANLVGNIGLDNDSGHIPSPATVELLYHQTCHGPANELTLSWTCHTCFGI